jgi:phosphoribosylanthranilate isomerase
MIQLHGSEDETFIRKITALTGLPVIKAFRIGGPEDLAAAAASSAPWVLLDSGSGTGRCFDWDLLDRFLKEQAAEHDGPLFPGGHQWILAGGLTAENVPAAIQRFHPDGVDVSSKVETGGWKDPAKMAAFLAAVRQSRV